MNHSPASDRPELEHQLAIAWPAAGWRDVQVGIAVSGGADSVALLRAMVALKQSAAGEGRLVVVHYDHRVRGGDSQEDARWVEQLASELGLPSVVGRSDREETNSSEERLRDERRRFFISAAERIGARYLVTAHTASDQAETVLFRALRGSGLSGLQGIAPFAPLTEACVLSRPLLGVFRQQVTDYLESIGQVFREDASNSSIDPTRNWIRHELLPEVAERFPDASGALGRLAEHAREASGVIDRLVDGLLSEALGDGQSPSGPRIELRIGVLASRGEAVAREVLRRAWRGAGWPEQSMTAEHWRRLGRLVESGEQRVEGFPGPVRAEVNGDRLTLTRTGAGAGSC